MRLSIALIILIGLIVGRSVQSGTGPNPLIELDVKTTEDGKLFYIETKVGEDNNRQPFNLLISTWSRDITWIESSSLSGSRGYSNSSTQIQDDPDAYNEAFVRHNVYRVATHSDTWHLGPMRLPDQLFAVLYPDSLYDRKPLRHGVDGMLSLKTEESSRNHLFRSLKDRGLINKHIYSLYINNSATLDPSVQLPVGKLTLGGINELYYSGEMVYIPMNSKVMEKQITNIRLDWTPVDQSRLDRFVQPNETTQVDPVSGFVSFDTTTIQYVGPRKLLDKIHLDFMAAKPIFGKAIYAFKDCRHDNKPNLVFEFHGGIFNATLEPGDYVIPTNINGRHVCISALKPRDIKLWIFGTQFLRKHYAVFDHEQNRLGLAQPI